MNDQEEDGDGDLPVLIKITAMHSCKRTAALSQEEREEEEEKVGNYEPQNIGQ